jgi:hypothetical protein
VDRWRAEWRDPGARVRWAISLLLLVAALSSWQQFLGWVELRPGVKLEDPVLDLFPPIDLTWPIFTLVYGGLIGAVVSLLGEPRALRIGVLGYALMVFVRIAIMYVTPLDPPDDMILLQDPMVGLIGVAKTPTRDLMFSGHTATLCLFAFASKSRSMRLLFTSAAAAIAVMMLFQHAHYTADILVAPLAAFSAYAIAARTAS